MPLPTLAYNERVYERLWRYTHYWPPERTPWWPVIEPLIPGAPNRLELGPGLWPKFPMRATHVVDLSSQTLGVLAEQGARVHRGLLHECGFADGTFELAGLFQVLEHVQDDEALLRELARVVKPGGHLLVGVPMHGRKWTAFDAFAGHVRRYEPDELLGKLARAGFVLERFEARAEKAGCLSALTFTVMCRYLPRMAMWFSEQILMRGQERLTLHWLDRTEWSHATRDAGQVTVLCRREPLS